MAKKGIAEILFGKSSEEERDEIFDDEEEIINREDYDEKEPEESAKKTPKYTSRSTNTQNKVVNISTTAQLQVVVLRPEKFNEAAEIAEHLKDKHTVAINFENTTKEIKRRMIDFLGGVTYANNGKVTKIDNNVYLMTPYNVGLIGDDIIDELEHNGMSFE